MDFERAAHIINMDLTGSDPGPPSHVKLIPNEPDLILHEDAFGQCWAEVTEPDETTDTQRSFAVEIHFDAETDLEAGLAASALAGFTRRRLGLENVVVIGRES